MAFLRLDRLINLYDGYRKTIRVDQLEVLMIQEGGEVCVVQSRCPHREFPLEKGSIKEGVITCPWHNMAFDLGTGVHLGGGCDSLKIYEPVFQGNLVGIIV
ncbi:MAG: Rieske 2Fe-2S domain-containing protein [Luminiphilus sp.]|jgi:nitrite reductase/ring-hydroxylating ferredoxin subunit|nr:Rieske 2Fe-2S domain-containing protein [Luminiphilus sp.]MDG1461437.1 Rieske 2Fe-2S domain-containing protein [Luminiphilus sp.]